MPKKFLKKYMSSDTLLSNNRSLQLISGMLNDANVWYINRRSATRAILLGLFIAFLPIPFHMIIAAFMCIVIRANLPISIAVVWVNNPITIAPIFYSEYKIGALILNIPHSAEFSSSLDWHTISKTIEVFGAPLFLGSLILATTASTIGYTIVNILWRKRTQYRWHHRHDKKTIIRNEVL